jgi:flagellar biosynthetic protein FliQ
MQSDQALQLLDELLWNAFEIAAPVLVACLVVGVVISVLQVATQLQEMTLSYVPKLFAAALTLVALGSWMIGHVTQFAISMIKLIPSLG